MPMPWITDSTIVPYLVYWVILRRPSSPSLESFSRYGHTTVNSWRMIDAEMYGMIPSAKTVILPSAPPEKRLMNPSRVPSAAFVNSAIATGSIPGIGMNDPNR